MIILLFSKVEFETDKEKITQAAMIKQMVDHDPAKRLNIDVTRASKRKFPGGTKVDTGPPNLIGPPSLIGAHAVKSFFVRCVQILI